MGRCMAAHQSSAYRSEEVSWFRSVHWHQPPTIEEYLEQVRGWGLDES